MKVTVLVQVVRDDGVTLTQQVETKTSTIWGSPTHRETRTELRKRLDRMVLAALNKTVGGR